LNGNPGKAEIAMMMNMHALAVGTEWFTVWITTDPKGKVTFTEEMDFILPRTHTAEQIMEVARLEITSDYHPDTRIIGVSSQSRGDFLWYEEGMKPR
jgi:hypothetical protein